ARTLGTTEDWGGGGRPEPAVALDQAGALGGTHPAAELDALCTFVKRIMQRLLESIVVDADRLDLRVTQAVLPQLLRRSRWSVSCRAPDPYSWRMMASSSSVLIANDR